MKLRFRGNTIRLRVNQREVKDLAAGTPLTEQVHFPDECALSYTLQQGARPDASFRDGRIVVAVPSEQIRQWAAGNDIGIYFELAADGARLKVAIEKDLECVEGGPEEYDADAFPRSGKNC